MKSKWDIGVVSAWEQKKLEASVSTGSTTRLCLGRIPSVQSALCWVGFVVEDIYHNDTN